MAIIEHLCYSKEQLRCPVMVNEGRFQRGKTVTALARVARSRLAAFVPRCRLGARFRQDLYYRLSVIVISLPPLRERRADIPMLVERFVQSASARAGRTVEVSSSTLDALVGYDWPGNVRELENTIERAVLFSRSTAIDVADLPDAIARSTASADLHQRVFADLPSLDKLERRYLAHVLQAVGGNRTRAAEVLRVDRRTLYRMAARFGLDLGEEL
jgi:DNA-binding NtrC family response regulator